MSYIKIGVAGPVGSGKTALIEALTRRMSADYRICVVTNDIYTKEDAEFLIKNSVIAAERIVGVETGGCPHTAIREDASMNLEAVETLAARFPDTQIFFIESGGDNLSATFSPELADVTVFIIDVAGGDKIPRKGGPGITNADLLVINKTYLAPHVGASLAVMERDAALMRGKKPYVFTDIRSGKNIDAVENWIRRAKAPPMRAPIYRDALKSPYRARIALYLLIRARPQRGPCRPTQCGAPRRFHPHLLPTSTLGHAQPAYSIRAPGAELIVLLPKGGIVGAGTGTVG